MQINQRPMAGRSPQAGFTLIEMAIVMLIIGLLLGGLLMPLSEQVNHERYRETEKQLNSVREALMGFALDQQRLPCPDTTGDGVEDSPCADVEGSVPWLTLGVGRLDGWQRPLRYRVDANFYASIPDPANTTSGLAIQQQDGTALTAANPDAPVAIVFSCGRDGLANDENDAAGADLPNCANPGGVNALYIQDAPNDDPANRFDDLLIWLSKNTLLNRLVSAGKWP